MNPRSAAHLSLVEGTDAFETASTLAFPFSRPFADGEAASCAMFFAKRSLSPLSSLSLLFMAPGRDFMLFRWMILTWSSGFSPAEVLVPVSTSSVGKASAKESSVATSFLFGRRRLGFFVEDLVTLLMSCSCFILRLSFFEAGNKDSCLLIVDAVVFLRIDLRGFAVRVGGALKDVSYIGCCESDGRHTIASTGLQGDHQLVIKLEGGGSYVPTPQILCA